MKSNETDLFVVRGELLKELHEGDSVSLADLQNLDVLTLVLIWWVVAAKIVTFRSTTILSVAKPS